MSNCTMSNLDARHPSVSRRVTTHACLVCMPPCCYMLYMQGEENYLFSLVSMTLKQLPQMVKDDQEVCQNRLYTQVAVSETLPVRVPSSPVCRSGWFRLSLSHNPTGNFGVTLDAYFSKCCLSPRPLYSFLSRTGKGKSRRGEERGWTNTSCCGVLRACTSLKNDVPSLTRVHEF